MGSAARAGALDPDLLRVVEQIVGLRMSEQGLLADLSDADRARVMEAVRRLLTPSEVAVAEASDEEGEAGATDTRAGDDVGFSEGQDGVAAPSRGVDAPTTVEDASSATSGSESSTRATEDSRADAEADPEAVRATQDTQDSVACAAWLVWDTNEDRVLSGADRYWRHFVVWIDDGDGVAGAEEMRDTFELGLRKLDLDLRSYEGARESTGVVERREIGGLERLRVELLRGDTDYGVLAIDLGGMVRGQAPRLRLRSSDGESVRELQDGYVPIQAGLEVEQVFGGQTRWRPLLCDR